MKEKTMCRDQYIKEPIEWFDGIPVFSKSDFYNENYERIANDHLRHFEKTRLNPFMNEDHWLEVEDSTSDIVDKYCAARDRILDVGVGMGRLLDRFPKHDRYGMDISRGYLKHAKVKGIDVCLSRIEDMPYKYQYFDCIVCADVLEHVLDLNLAFTKITSVLKPGGFLIARVPYRENLQRYLEPSYKYDLVHLRNFDEYAIQLFVEKIFNLKLIEWSVCGFIGGRQKFNFPIPKVNGLVRRAVRATKMLGDDLYRSSSRIFNYPAEINFVVHNEKNKQRD
jgi:SAM-dependent methyltransferase